MNLTKAYNILCARHRIAAEIGDDERRKTLLRMADAAADIADEVGVDLDAPTHSLEQRIDALPDRHGTGELIIHRRRTGYVVTYTSDLRVEGATLREAVDKMHKRLNSMRTERVECDNEPHEGA